MLIYSISEDIHGIVIMNETVYIWIDIYIITIVFFVNSCPAEISKFRNWSYVCYNCISRDLSEFIANIWNYYDRQNYSCRWHNDKGCMPSSVRLAIPCSQTHRNGTRMTRVNNHRICMIYIYAWKCTRIWPYIMFQLLQTIICSL